MRSVSRHLWVLGVATDKTLHAAARAGRALPIANPKRHGVEVIRDIAYLPTGRRAHRLDVYCPVAPRNPGRAVLYIHGGGFGILSKDSHWLMALIFARRGFVVFNISYRLAPKHPYPAAFEDACAAYAWVARNAQLWGADPERLVLAGESAGGNLIAALAIAACYRRPEPSARSVWDTGVVPRAVLPASAIFQVSDCARFGRRRKMSRVVTSILEGVGRAYLREGAGDMDFADPLCVFERGQKPDRPLPPFFAAVGTRDPLLDDTRRLAAAMTALGAECQARYYENRIHVFHAAVWRRAARRYWRDAFAFIEPRLE